MVRRLRMSYPLNECREAFEKWLNTTYDCKYDYSPVCGYIPQEIYQLYQA